MPTIKDVAKRANVAISTVSKYINGGNVLKKNQEAIKSAIDELDYRINDVARALKTNRSMTIGVLIPGLENTFFTGIISRMEDAFRQKGYSTILCDYKGFEDNQKSAFEFLLGKQVDGLVLVLLGENNDFVNQASTRGIPILLLDRPAGSVDADVVIVDTYSGAKQATHHLIECGHKNIAVITGPDESYTARERKNGFIDACKEMSINSDNIFMGNYEIEGGYKATNQILNSEKEITAILATNYEMTLGCIMAINEKGIKIPDQISLIGFDDETLTKVINPPLTIVAQPTQTISKEAASILLKRLEGDKSETKKILLQPNLKLRKSVKIIN